MTRVGEIWEWKVRDEAFLFLVVSEESHVLQMFELAIGQSVWLSAHEIREVTLINGTAWRRMA